MLENEEDEDVIIEAIAWEGNSEDVVHRLTATLALLLHSSPLYDMQLMPLLEVFQSQEVLMHKIGKGEGEGGEKAHGGGCWETMSMKLSGSELLDNS
ncbi:hypothetical protein L208DRAFT_1411178 [Tricholoma matsutake]|nr:hypothetical protein L208DRAFT_1411178 [Tricholoma matsutake 945]